MYTPRRLLLALVSISALFLPACTNHSADMETQQVEVLGEFGAPVTITIDGNLSIDELKEKVLIDGQGRKLEKNSPILARITSFDSRTQSPINEYNTGKVHLSTLTEENFKNISSSLIGKTEGTRILFERPGLVSQDKNAVEIIVVDILHTHLQGEALPVTNPPAGMPVISQPQAGQGPIEIQSGGGAIPSLETVTLISGHGQQLSATDAVAMHYELIDTGGTIVTNSWDQGPVRAEISQLMPGMVKGLSDQKVGSRVMIMMPSSEAKGEGDIVAVVDILAQLDPHPLTGHD